MFIRKNRKETTPTSPREESVGVGALVTVTGGASGASGDSGWEGEPTGVVIGPGDNEMAGYPGLAPGGPISWLIAFAEPAYKVGNAVPFDEATVAARFVTLLPSTVASDDDGAGDDGRHTDPTAHDSGTEAL
ncbi:hypothetical protein [Subtercola endophyticus]|uniref:hypothetical protein n=1 Tax=Subtercola endophyticus TaxID=2895559 RepID=UPI001E30CC92|nr:hypothetical protein [Subtercola endophyticus]UFS59577.1 hypothetical protein LQ955_01890 [Subtercola endophyticus]